MKFFDLFTQNPHDAGFEQVKNAKFWVGIEQEFLPKPYDQENSDLYHIAFLGSFLCNAISAATAATHIFMFLSGLIPFSWLAGTFSVLILFFLEGAKRYTAPKLFKQFIQYRKLSVGFLLVSLGLMLLSTTFSYFGAKQVIFATAAKPQLTDIVGIRERYATQKQSVDAQLKEVVKRQSWKEKLTPVGQKSYQNLLSQQNTIVIAEQQEIDKASSNNEMLSANSQIDTSETANYFAAFTAIIEALLLICLFYCVYYRYRSFAERTKVAHLAETHYRNKELSENTAHFAAPKPAELSEDKGETTIEMPEEELQEAVIEANAPESLQVPANLSTELQKEIADKIRAIQKERNKVTTAEWRLKKPLGLTETNMLNISKGNEELQRLRAELSQIYEKAKLNFAIPTLFPN